MDKNATYLGDGVYATVEMGLVKVFTTDGIDETNVIYFEPDVYNAFTRFFERVVKAGQKAEE